MEGDVGDYAEHVAGNERLGLSPDGPDGLSVVSRFVFVLNVVMHQGEVVDELQRDCGGQGVIDVSADGFASEQTERGSDGFACHGGYRRAGFVGPAHVISEHIVNGRAAQVQIASQRALNQVAVVVEHCGKGYMAGAVVRHGSDFREFVFGAPLERGLEV